MKRIYAAVLGAIVSNFAFAQCSVILYGVVDENIEYVSNMSNIALGQPGFPGNGKTRVGLTSGGLSGSRWGLRGIEDLGGGLKALFVLESGFGADDGKLQNSGRLFGRQGFVGLDSAGIGRVTFGRQYTAIFDAFSNFSPTGFSTQYEPIAAELGLDFRSDNMAKYTGTFGPVTAIADWSFGNGVAGAGEVPGQFRRDSGYGAAVTYLGGNVGVAIAFNQFNPTLAQGAPTGNFRKAGAAMSYTAGPAKVMAGYRWGLNKTGSGATVVRDDMYWVGANYDVGSALRLTLSYFYDDVKNLAGVNVTNPWQVAFVADYNFSKRTDVYLTTAYAKHSGLNFDTSAVSFANGYYLGRDKNGMLGVALGIRHKF
ncbi:porin [Cupriavidus oxalaticus]|uniref:Porin n=1 Tax=Cupriavidus oxalaticus TaxID=96344 RepID=A0A4P7LJ67_9BURK|nr:porin [Cupriavidus oxalaticus]QBY56200.1 porin [Cupriavidus oxalaticus]